MPKHQKVPFVLSLAGLLLAGAACADASQPSAKDGEQPTAAGTVEVAARIGDKTITLAEVDRKAMATGIKPFQDLYEARRRAVEELVSEHLLDAEAAERGVSRDELFRTEVEQKIAAVTDDDIQTWYGQNQARLQGQTLEQLSPRIREFLTAQRESEARAAYFDMLKAKAELKISLDPPRMEIELAEGEPAKGPSSAPVTIVGYSDFQCPYCSSVNTALNQVVETYGDKVRIVFRDFPLPTHQQAPVAGEAAQCAHDQGKFWEYHDALFANQRALNPPDLKRYAVELGLDAEKFNECLDSGRHRDSVAKDHLEGQKLGVTGTPAFFVNGRFLSGAQPFEAFAQVIDEELAN